MERAAELGGLMRSVENRHGDAFDLGTHYVLDTGIPDLDRNLVDFLNPSEWYCFTHSLPEGHIFNAVRNDGTGSIDARTLPADLLDSGILDLLRCGAPSDDPENLHQHFVESYGETFTEHVFRPVLERLHGARLEELAPEARNIFSVKRLVAFDQQQSIGLKRSPLLDGKIAYTRAVDGSSSIRKYYPRQGGVGQWVRLLERRARAAGVRILTGAAIEAIDIDGTRVTQMRVDDGETLPVAQLYWTGPLQAFQRAAGLPLAGGRPPARDLVLFHLRVDAALQTDVHWSCFYDRAVATYRVTCYPNITLDAPRPPPHTLTVEVLTDSGAVLDGLERQVVEELQQFGLLGETCSIVEAMVQVMPSALPILTTGAVRSWREDFRTVVGAIDNLTYLGPAPGAHGLRHTLTEVHYATQEAPGRR